MSHEARSGEPFWVDEKDWLVNVLTVDLGDPQDRAVVAEQIGYLQGYAHMTNTRTLALVGDPQCVAYELLFSFDTPEHKAQFLELANSNELTEFDPEDWMVPSDDEIRGAKPLTAVIPADMMRQALLISVSLASPGDADHGIQ